MTTTPTVWRADQQANTSDTVAGGSDQHDDQTGIRLVGLTNGNFVALWDDNSDLVGGAANGTDIIGQIYDPLGNRIGGEFRINQNFTGDDEGNATAAALPNGNFVVVYEDTDDDGTSIRFVVRTATGAIVHSGTILADANDLARGQPSVSVAGDGSFVVAFQQDQPDGFSSPAVVVAVKVSSAFAVGPPDVAMTSESGESSVDVRTDVATLTNGSFVTVGVQFDEGGNEFQVPVTFIDADGSAGNSVFGAGETSTNGTDDVAPAVAALTGGGFVVVWENTDANDTDTQFQIYTATGVEVGVVRSVNNTGGDDDKRRPDIVGLADGGFVIVYDDNADGEIKLQRYNATGAEIGAEVSVSTTSTQFVGDPTVTLTDDGRLLVGWRQSALTGPVGTTVDNDVHFAIFDPRDDTINGDNTDETITSRIDGARVNGNGGADRLLGQAGADRLLGGGAVDTLKGGGGDDFLLGGAEIDTVDGEAGSDVIRVLEGELGDHVNGGAGDPDGLDTDRLDLSVITSRHATVNLSSGLYAIFNADESVFGTICSVLNVEAVDGTQLGDTITGNTRPNALDGNKGDDSLSGGLAVDTLNGGAGNDTLLGGDSTDIVNGGSGSDVIRVLQDERGDRTDGGTGGGTDTLDLSAITTRFAIVDLGVEYTIRDISNTIFGVANTLLNVEHVIGTKLGDVLNGDSLSNRLDGSDGDDVLSGDSLPGNVGVDTLNGGIGDDLLFGGGGNDRVNGDAGNDTIFVLDGEFGDRTDGGADTDLLDLSNVDTRRANVDLANLQYTILNGDNSAFGGTSYSLVNVEDVGGTPLADQLFGDSLANALVGNGGDDALSGRGQADTLVGGEGADTLTGGAGADELTGDNGADVFDYGTTQQSRVGAARDRIADFSASAGDLIDLSDIDAMLGTGGNQAFTFIGATGFSAEGQIRAIQAGADTRVLINNSGAGGADMEILLRNFAPADLTSGDFVP